MRRKRRILGLVVALAGALAGGSPARGQEHPEAPAAPPGLPALPAPVELKSPPAPPVTTPAAPVVPAAPAPTPNGPPPAAPGLPPPPGAQVPAAPAMLPAPGKLATPVMAPPAASPVADIPVEPAAGPTNANPTGRQEPGVSLEWICPSTARLGQPVTCQILVKSLSLGRLHNVVLRARLPAAVQIKAMEPKANSERDTLVWDLGTLEPRQERRMDLQLVPTAKLNLSLNAFVTFTGASTTRLDVREPKLVLKATAPKKVVTGDPAAVALTVNNPGDATAERVKIKATLTPGLEHGRGQTVDFNLDSLAPGETRTVLVMCSARAVGEQGCAAVATAEPGLSAQDSAAVEVVAPRIEVEAAGPGMRYLDRQAVYSFKVTNPGTAVASHVTLTDHVPPGFKVVAASNDGRHDFVSRSVVWFLGDLGPGENKEVTLKLAAINPGEHRHKVVVTAARGLRAQSEVVTRVEGLPALLMELVDVDDPIEVGKETSYEIRVTNTGTKTETNLQLSCTIPEQMEFRGARGAAGCPFKMEGREIVFEPLPKLAPRVDAIYRVTVRCAAPGDVRFQARMKADGLTQPVLREESTRLYGDEVEAPRRPQ